VNYYLADLCSSRKYLDQIKDLQTQLEVEQRARDDAREQYASSERRSAVLQSEKEEAHQAQEAVIIFLKQKQSSHFGTETLYINRLIGPDGRLKASCTIFAIKWTRPTRRRRRWIRSNASWRVSCKLCTWVHTKLIYYPLNLANVQVELDANLSELKNSEENTKRVAAEADRLASDLRQEQDRAMNVDKARKNLENQIKELQTRLDDAEKAALQGGKKIIQKLEQKVALVFNMSVFVKEWNVIRN